MKRLFLFILMFFSILVFSGNVFAENDDEGQVVLVGKVDVKYNDDFEDAISIEFHTMSGMYYIKRDAIGKKIIDHDSQNIEVTGKVLEKNGTKIITVTKFTVIKDDIEEENDNEDGLG